MTGPRWTDRPGGSRQARALDPAERKKLVIQLQKIVLDNAYYMPGLWWTRNVVHLAKVRNYVAPPSHYTSSWA
jgi:peptide/nickel transport system substrate-binding protein